MKKLVTLLLALAMVLSIAPVTLAEDAEIVTLDWYFGQTEQPDGADVNAAINEYLGEKIGVNVNLHFWSGDEYWDRMRTMISAGQDCGIIGFGSQTKLDYVVESQRGAYYPLDDLLAEFPETYGLFSEDIWNGMRIGGKIYGIPSKKDNGYFISLIYNDTLAQELGVDPTAVEYTSYDDFEEIFYQVKEKRDAAHPEWAEYPVIWNADLVFPYYFGFETFLNDSYIAVCNIDGIDDIAGVDGETVVNFYETPEFLEFCLMRQRWVEDGIYAYDYTDRQEWQYTGAIFGWMGWGYTYMEPHMYGDTFETKMIMCEHLWTDTNNFFSAGTAISANCADPEAAMKVLNLVNTDPTFATMMRFGIEGTHYTYDDAGVMTFTERNATAGSRGYYNWYMAPIGNLTIVNAPEQLTGPEGVMLTNMNHYNDICLPANHMGFVFDTTPVATEIAACTSIVMEYQTDLVKGILNSQEEVQAYVAEFTEKLKANGSEAIVAEVQRQIDAWKAAK